MDLWMASWDSAVFGSLSRIRPSKTVLDFRSDFAVASLIVARQGARLLLRGLCWGLLQAEPQTLPDQLESRYPCSNVPGETAYYLVRLRFYEAFTRTGERSLSIYPRRAGDEWRSLSNHSLLAYNIHAPTHVPCHSWASRIYQKGLRLPALPKFIPAPSCTNPTASHG